MKRENTVGSEKIDRRGMLQSIGASTIAGASIVGLSGVASASQCPDLDNDGEYIDCDHVNEEIDFIYRPHEHRVKGETSLSVGLRGYTADHCKDCVYYHFDLAGIHEGSADPNERGDFYNYVDDFGFRCHSTGSAKANPHQNGSSNIDCGLTNSDGSTTPSTDEEDSFWALGDVLVAGGTVLYPQLTVPAFLYTITRSGNTLEDNHSGNDDEVEIVFNDDGYSTPAVGSAAYGYYNLRVEVPTYDTTTVKFDSFTNLNPGGYHESEITTKSFFLDQHVPPY